LPSHQLIIEISNDVNGKNNLIIYFNTTSIY
jgi:hypothetical protein